MASKPRQEEVKALLKPLEAELTAWFMTAWDRWLKNPERHELFRRTRACLVHNYAMLLAVPAMQDQKGIRVFEKHETAVFMVDDRLLFRMKKGDERGVSSNVETQSSLAFVDPDEPQFSLFTDLPDIWRVDVAYVLNDLETLIREIVVVARDEDRIIWSYQIYPTAAAEGESLTPLPVSPRSPPSADSTMRIPGADREEKQNKGE